MRILFVEDQRVLAELVIERFLRDHEVQLVASLAAARAVLADQRYDVALIDHDLPDGKGTALVRELRASCTRVIAVSAKADGNQALRAAGAHDVCAKAELHRIADVLARNAC